MGCEEFAEAKIARLYDEEFVEPPGFEEHIAQCPACREDLDEFDEVSLLYREASVEPMPLALRAKVLSPAPRRKGWEYVAAAGLAAALLLALVMWSDPPEAADIAWDKVDFQKNYIILVLTPEEREQVIVFRNQPPTWDRSSFASKEIDLARRRLDALSVVSPWSKEARP